MPYKVTYYIGKFDKDTNKQELSNEYFINQIVRRLGDCTIIRTKGCYTMNATNKQVHEPSLKVEQIISNDEYYVQDVIDNCKHFKKIFHQESILYTIQELDFDFV